MSERKDPLASARPTERCSITMLTIVSNPSELAMLLKANAREGSVSIDDTAAWLANPRNFALRHGNDLGLFEAKDEWPGPLHAHVFFASRGKEALTIARMMLDQAFAYGATEILGETPKQFRDAWIFARLLGFRPYGETERLILSRLAKHNCPERQKAA